MLQYSPSVPKIEKHFLTISSYTSLQANYLSIPVYVLASIGTGLTTFVSDRIGRRAICLIHSPILVIAGYAVAVGSGNKSVGFFAMFLVGAGVYSYNTVVLTYVSDLFNFIANCRFPNALTVGFRTISIPTRSDRWRLL